LKVSIIYVAIVATIAAEVVVISKHTIAMDFKTLATTMVQDTAVVISITMDTTAANIVMAEPMAFMTLTQLDKLMFQVASLVTKYSHNLNAA
jgi:hypothetical protein